MNRQGKTLDAIEERMQSANKSPSGETFWSTGAKMCRGGSSVEDWWTMCIQSFSFGSEIWSLTIQTMDRIKRWETKIMMRLFRFRRGKDETLVDYHTRCCKAARKMWIQMGFFLFCMI